MLQMRLLTVPLLAAVLVLGGCDDDDDDGGFFTAPGGPTAGGGGPGFDVDCNDDDDPPSVRSISASPAVLWPPDHRLVPVTVHASAVDDCDPLDIRIVHVASDEPVDGLGDGDTAPDWEIAGPLTLRLRAERSGLGNGRTYTIRVRYRDGVGNEEFEHVRVLVPHDQGE
jgi:hypothetical protein